MLSNLTRRAIGPAGVAHALPIMAAHARGMATEKELRDKITSTTNIEKITSSMKMVAASKMKGDEQRMEASRTFAGIFDRLRRPEGWEAEEGAEEPTVNKEMIIVVSSDKGLCGGVNSNVSKVVRQRAAEIESNGGELSLSFVGDKSRGQLGTTHGSKFDIGIDEATKVPINFTTAACVAERLAARDFDACTVVHNHASSALAYHQETKTVVNTSFAESEDGRALDRTPGWLKDYNFDPEDKSEALANLFEFTVAGNVFVGIVDSAHAEQSQRMVAMDNASSNAGDMIKKFTLQYNRVRQAKITTELIEIISGAESLKSSE